MYNRKKAVEYAKKYAFEYNNDFYNFTSIGGDCTNFISQCLFAGGLEMDYSQNGWFYQSIYQRSPSWTSVEDLWNYGLKNRNIKLKQINMQDLEIGDIIQFFDISRQKYYHCVIVTKIIKPISKQNILVSCHDYDAFNKSLALYSETNFRFGKIMN
ncbi:MAG: amidase domain-containing protein [Christensenellales bacterium]